LSRHYILSRDGMTWIPRSRPRPYSAAWKAARARRAAARQGQPEQQRDMLGFIVRQRGHRQEVYDPGKIDRFLFLRSRGEGS